MTNVQGPGGLLDVILHGIGVSPGVVIGPVYKAGPEVTEFSERLLNPGEVSDEISRFKAAVVVTRRQITVIQNNVKRAIGHQDATIFDVHKMILDDAAFFDETIRLIAAEHWNAETAVRTVTSRYIEALSAVEDDYLRERVADFKDVAWRVLRNLTGEKSHALDGLHEKSIVVSPDLAPSETASLRKSLVLGFVTDMGSRTSHSAIVARAMGIPAVVGLGDATHKLSSGDWILMDGTEGVVILRPSEATLKKYNKLAQHRKMIEARLTRLSELPAETLDHHRVTLAANIEFLEEARDIHKYGAHGVGLLRSEYLYIAHDELPTEEEQLAAYKGVVDLLAPEPVIIRTVDLGGDKFASSVRMPPEMNPFLGFRAIRFCLAQPEMFKTQLRAILRASAFGKVRVMYPMISNVGEVIRSNAILEECKADLRRDGIAFDAAIEVGVMIEIPSAALTADIIAKHVSFFSIGTNDLAQYTLAVDRVNDRVAHLYEPTHPAVLRLIKLTVEAAQARGIRVGVCGQMGGDPLMTLLLLGLGIDELSMVPASIPAVKELIRSATLSQALELAKTALSCETAPEVLKHCRALITKVAPEILELVK